VQGAFSVKVSCWLCKLTGPACDVEGEIRLRWVIAEDLWRPLPKWLTEDEEVLYDATLSLDVPRLRSALEHASVLIVRNHTRCDAELLEHAPGLKVIGRLGVGLDNIDLEACREHSVHVIAARGGNANAVVEYVLAAMFAHARPLFAFDAYARGGKWERTLARGRELTGCTLGLVGVGDIGQRLAWRAHALGMRVVGYDPYLPHHHRLLGDGVLRQESLLQVCREADYLSLHLPLTPATHHLIGEAELAEIKTNAVLIHTARGGIVDERALWVALQTHPARRAVLDVREQEPPSTQDPLQQLPNVLLTPHVAGITEESSERVAEFILTETRRLLSGEFAQGLVV
jgi:D-3-phosphoglycerate dehydrogenase/(S)-sulfolactate dehydrogenase